MQKNSFFLQQSQTALKNSENCIPKLLLKKPQQILQQEKTLQIPKESFLKKNETLFTKRAMEVQKKHLRKQTYLKLSIQFSNTSKLQLN